MTESVFVGKPRQLLPSNYTRDLINGDCITWWRDNPYRISLAKRNDGCPGFRASTEFDGWIDTTTYDEVGFFVKEDGVIRFARVSHADLECGDLHAQAMVEIWNVCSGKKYELVGEGIGWAACKRNRNDVPPGVDLKEVCRFYYLDENLNPIP